MESTRNKVAMRDYLDQVGLWVCLCESILTILLWKEDPPLFPRETGGPELWKKRKVTEVNIWIAFSSWILVQCDRCFKLDFQVMMDHRLEL